MKVKEFKIDTESSKKLMKNFEEFKKNDSLFEKKTIEIPYQLSVLFFQSDKKDMLDLKNSSLILPENDVQALFDYILESIFKLIDKQISNLKNLRNDKIFDFLFLVG
jgi:hypothetical protein